MLARRVLDGLNALHLVRGVQTTIVCDHGLEFVSLALDPWASARGVRLDFIRRGRPLRSASSRASTGVYSTNG